MRRSTGYSRKWRAPRSEVAADPPFFSGIWYAGSGLWPCSTARRRERMDRHRVQGGQHANCVMDIIGRHARRVVGRGTSAGSGSSNLPRFAVKRVAFQRARSAGLSARWLGQDGHDYVGPNERLAPSDIQDIHIAIAGLDPGREVVFRRGQVNQRQLLAVCGEAGRVSGRIQTGERSRGRATYSSSLPRSRPGGRFTCWFATRMGTPSRPTCAAARPMISSE